MNLNIASALGAISMDEAGETAKWENQCALSKKQRLIGFLCCCGFGVLIGFLSFLFWSRPTTFALLFTIGNIVSVASTGFIVGFLRQLKWAFAMKRVAATVTFVLAMIGTIIAATVIRSVALAIVCIIIQLCALIWYTLTYIPFGQQMLTSMLTRCVRA